MNAAADVLPTVTGAALRPGAEVRLDGHGHAWIAPPSLAAEEVPALADEELLVAGLTGFAEAARPRRAALLDCQAPGSGRDVAALARLAAKSGVEIAAVTGFHFSRAYPRGLRPWTSVEGALGAFTRELDGGFREAPMARAAAVKVAYGGTPEPDDPCWEAAIAAREQTGSLLLVHTEAGAGVEALIDWLRSRGVPLERIYLLDVDRRADIGLHVELASAGLLVGFAASLRPSGDGEPFALLRGLIDQGHARSVAVGLDLASPTDWGPAAHAASAGGPAALVTIVEERLRREGVAEGDIDALLGGTLLARTARPEVPPAARRG
jgi:5-phospho-D-xylono-1,4-lactonase